MEKPMGEMPLGWSLPFGSFRVDKPGPDALGDRPIIEHTVGPQPPSS